jgi:hypothetical protein
MGRQSESNHRYETCQDSLRPTRNYLDFQFRPTREVDRSYLDFPPPPNPTPPRTHRARLDKSSNQLHVNYQRDWTHAYVVYINFMRHAAQDEWHRG